MMINPYTLKAIIFEIYSAGYMDGVSNRIGEGKDVKTSFEMFYKQLEDLFEKNE